MEAVEEEEQARDATKNWSTDTKTFSSVTVTVVPGGHFGHSVLHGCMTKSCSVFHHVPPGGLQLDPRVALGNLP